MLGIREISVVLVNPGQRSQSTQIPNDLAYFEELIGAPVSVEKFLISGYRLVCSVDEGYGYDNSTLPKGTYFIAKYQGSFEGMSMEETEHIKRLLRGRAKGRKKKGIMSLFSR
ncbi:hypothetical protein [Pseudalkalibacillus salsuginis]|uniref:hypothetical protein n=1 Tax=Pseudalkalibacillus salsuginis TaxID=2910972 RepID=UPI001F40E407|nr:hypothetical protein [Pseudalkalibacillus salsuginis]MCF6410075.1 hypothetical protein [Pseudalkalibacillus salsuginis]